MGTILVLLVLMAAVAGIFWHLRKQKQQGKCSCGGSCGECAGKAICHSKKAS